MPWRSRPSEPHQTNVDVAVRIAHERSERVREVAKRILAAPDARAMLALDQEPLHRDDR